MRGIDHQQSQMFSYLSLETRVRKDHPLRAIRAMSKAAHKLAQRKEIKGRPNPVCTARVKGIGQYFNGT